MTNDTINKKELLELLVDLISIDSVNPFYDDTKKGEGALGYYVYDYLIASKVECELDEVHPDRYNVTAFIKGNDRRGICFETHLDTVNVKEDDKKHLLPRVEDGYIYGRGSCDAKASLAAIMYAMKTMKDKGIIPLTDIYLAAVVDEEAACSGINHMLKRGLDVSAAVIGEPTSLRTVIACKGVIRAKMHAKGRVGHSSQIKGSDNAIVNMALFTVFLGNRLEEENKIKTSFLTGVKTFNPGKILGGYAANIIPDLCTLDFEIRILPDETKNDIWNWLNCVISDFHLMHPKNRIILEEPYIVDEGYEISSSERISQICSGSTGKIAGIQGLHGVYYGCDATKFHRAGIPAVVLGPGDIDDAHSDHEKVCFNPLAARSPPPLSYIAHASESVGMG